MKRFFRERRTSLSSNSKPVVSAAAPLTSPPSEVPLHARFSTVHRKNSQDGPSKPIVSGPMQLTSKASKPNMSRSRTTSITGGSSQNRQSRVLTRKSSRQEPSKSEPSWQGLGKQDLSGEGVENQELSRRETIRQEQRGQQYVRLEPMQYDVESRQLNRRESSRQDYGRQEYSRQVFGRQEEIEQPKVLASPPPRFTSRLPAPAPTLPDIALESSELDFSAVLRAEPRRSVVGRHEDLPYAEALTSTNALQPTERSSRSDNDGRIRTNSFASSSSCSARSPSPSRRRLVVRNASPEDTDDGTELEPPSDIRKSDLMAINMFVNSAGSDEPAASSSQVIAHGSFGDIANGHGFALRKEDQQYSGSYGSRRDGSGPNVKADATITTRTYASSPAAPAEQPSPVEQNGHEHVITSQDLAKPAPSALLQSSPSVNRKKYSPLAAFGLPVRQPGTLSTTSLASESKQTKEYADQIPANNAVERLPIANDKPLPSPSELSPPVLSSPPTRHSSKQLPYAESSPDPFDNQRTITPSRRDIRHSEGCRYDDPDRQSRRRDLNEQAIPETRDSRYAPVEQLPPQYEEVYDLPSTPPVPAPLHHEISKELIDRAAYVPQAPLVGHDPRFTDSQTLTTQQQPMLQRGPSVRLNASRQSAYMSDQALRAAPQQGRPLIFRAMESTPDVHGIAPEIVGMIGKASVQAKSQEVYNAYYSGPSQTSTPPPEARTRALERDGSTVKKKPSKLHKRNSSSKLDPIKADPVRVMLSGVEKRHEAALWVPDEGRPVGDLAASRRPSHRQVSATGFHVGPPSPPMADSPNLERNGSRHMSLDAMASPRRRDGARPLTEKQREMLQSRQSYVGDMSTQAHSPPPERRKSIVDPNVPHWHTDAAAYAAQFPRGTAYMPAEMASSLPLARSGTMQPVEYSGPQQPAQEAAYPPGRHDHNVSPPKYQYGGPQQSAVEFPRTECTNSGSSAGILQEGLTTSPTQIAFPQQPLPPSPPKLATPPEYTPDQTRKLEKKRRTKSSRGHGSSSSSPKEPSFYPLAKHLHDQALLENLLDYLSYYEWTNLCAANKKIRRILYLDRREQVLERYLRTVGYTRWMWSQPEPLPLTVQDLCDYMHGVSIPSYRYAAIASNYLQANSTVEARTIRTLAAACRAFTRVVLRLRCQAEAEAAHNARAALSAGASATSLASQAQNGNGRTNGRHSYQTPGGSRSSSRAPSPSSSYSTLPGMHGRNSTATSRPPPNDSGNIFQSPLFRLRRAPLLQVFVPSPEGDWLSDATVLECESELKRASVLHLMRAGDVIWDVAAGDEGNVGRLVWDGSYLIDLDYTYSRVGDPPRYLPSLAFPPSYFHRIIRTMGMGNPVVRIDVSPWGEEIMRKVRLLQDRIRTETPQGGRHTVVRWVHRSSFTIRAPPGTKSIRLPMPQTAGAGPSPTGAWVVDPDWFGVVILETEGTNEGQADLQIRCQGMAGTRFGVGSGAEKDRRTVWRILREKSRPGEIWIRAVIEKERLISA